MDALKHKPVIIFFSVLLAVIAAAYLLHTFNPPQRLPQRIDEIDNDSASGFIIRDQQGKMLMQTGLPVYVNDEFIDEDNLHYSIIKVAGKATE